MSELFTESQKQYLKKLTTEYQSHNLLCESLSIEQNKRESFFNGLIKLTDRIDYIDKKGGFGNPDYFVKLKNVSPVSQILINTGNNYGNINQSSGASFPSQEINITNNTIEKKLDQNKSALVKLWLLISNNKLVSGILLLGISGFIKWLWPILKAKKIIP